MAVWIEFGTHRHVGADQGAHVLQQISFAVVIAIGDHSAVQAKQHHVHGQGCLQVGQQLVPQPLVGVARGDAAGLRGGDHALDQCPARIAAAQARSPQRP